MADFVRDLTTEYLTKIFGSNEGMASFAAKGKNGGWSERSFPWPAGRTDAITWIKTTTPAANVFVCPALRNDAEGLRIKGDGKYLRWLWADVDWDKVPASRRDVVAERINELGTYVVLSGSGSNVHVYVKLRAQVSAEQFHRLNTGLRDYFFADNKQADSSLLRVPGTVNWKTPLGTPVGVQGGHGKSVAASSLLAIKTFSNVDAKQSANQLSVDWTPTPVPSHRVPRRLQLMLKMTSDEAKGRFGARYQAVWAITGDLHKAGFGTDEIHTLLNEFIPAIEKREDENYAYDVHKDIERRLSKDRLKEDSSLDMPGDDEDSAFEELSDEEGNAYAEDEMVQKILARRAAIRAADRIEAESGFTGPPPDASWSLSDALIAPPQPAPYIIEGLAGEKHNVIITAQYKTGKTAFTLGSLAQALADGTPFLGEYAVNVPEGGTVVGHWNCEMDPTELLDSYLRPVGYECPHNLKVWNLRGYVVNILTPLGKASAISWLKGHGVKVWTIDSLARLARMAGVTEKDNDEMLNLLMAVDEIKVEAGVDVCFIIAHTGRMQHEEGQERARGATVIDDWPDARWIMTKEGNSRFLAVEGRGVSMKTTALVFDPETNRSVMGYGGKAETLANGAVQAVLEVVVENEGIGREELIKLLGLKLKMTSKPALRSYITDAIEADFVVVKFEKTMARGAGKQCHYPAIMKEPGGATKRVVNMAAADRPFRKRRGAPAVD